VPRGKRLKLKSFPAGISLLRARVRRDRAGYYRLSKSMRICRSVCEQSVVAGLLPNRHASRHSKELTLHGRCRTTSFGISGSMASRSEGWTRYNHTTDLRRLVNPRVRRPGRPAGGNRANQCRPKHTAILSSAYRFRRAGVSSLINCPKRLGIRRWARRLYQVADWRQRQHVCGSSR
jgi:hypothetical protein